MGRWELRGSAEKTTAMIRCVNDEDIVLWKKNKREAINVASNCISYVCFGGISRCHMQIDLARAYKGIRQLFIFDVA